MALKGNPKDVQLLRKLGTALVKMHDYDRAIQHYEDAYQLLNNEEINFEYLDLLIKVNSIKFLHTICCCY